MPERYIYEPHQNLHQVAHTIMNVDLKYIAKVLYVCSNRTTPARPPACCWFRVTCVLVWRFWAVA